MKKVEINFKPSASGSPTAPKFRAIIKKDGDIELVPDGVKYVDLEIQSYADSCDLNVIIQRFLSGDVNAIPDPSGAVFADLTRLPATRQEVLQSVIDAQRVFEEFPLDVRQKFDNDWMKFYIQYEEMASIVASKPPEEEVKE